MNDEHVGDAFVPWRRFRGVMIPDAVLASKLSPGAKLVYGVLAKHAGKDGACYPAMHTIGRCISRSERQAKSYIAELARHGFVRRTRGGRGRSNRYVFLWHALFDGQDLARVTGGKLPTKRVHEVNEDEHDPDYLATHHENGDASPDRMAPALLEHGELSALVAAQLGRNSSRGSIERIISATPHQSEAEALVPIRDAIRRGYDRHSKHAPRSIQWFVTVVERFYADRAQRALPPQAPEFRLDPEKFRDMTSALDPFEGAA